MIDKSVLRWQKDNTNKFSNNLHSTKSERREIKSRRERKGWREESERKSSAAGLAWKLTKSLSSRECGSLVVVPYRVINVVVDDILSCRLDNENVK